MAFIPLINNRKFDFSAMGSSGNLAITVLSGIDRTKYKTATLVVRIEAKTITAGNTIDVNLYSAWPLALQPEEDYRGAATVASVTISNTLGTVGQISDSPIATASGPTFDLVVKGTNTAAANNMVVISVGLMVFED